MTRRAVKWAHLDEIDYRTSVGSPAWWSRHHLGARRLSAWRRMHMLGNHARIRWFARRILGLAPSSRITTREMVRAIRRFERTGKFHSRRQLENARGRT